MLDFCEGKAPAGSFVSVSLLGAGISSLANQVPASTECCRSAWATITLLFAPMVQFHVKMGVLSHSPLAVMHSGVRCGRAEIPDEIS